MIRLTTTLERTALATLAVALSALTLVTATVAPMSAEQPALSATLKPTVETVLLSYEPSARATRVN